MAPDANPITLSVNEASLDALADAIAERIEARGSRRTEPQDDRWLDSGDAARYLGISRDAIHKLTSGRQLAFSQRIPGAPCFFRRRDLDAYREGFMRGGR